MLALSALGHMVHCFVMALVSGSRCRCVWVLPVVYDWIFREMLGTQCLVRQWMVSVVSGCCLWSNWISVEMLRAQFLVRQWIHVLRQLREVL